MSNSTVYLNRDRLHFFILMGIVAFGTLDGMRDTFFSNNPISYLKEFLPFFGLTLLFYHNPVGLYRLKAPYSYWIFAVGYLGFLWIAILNTKHHNGDYKNTLDALNAGGWSIIVKLLSFFGLGLYLYALRKFIPRIYSKTPSLYVFGVTIYCLLTVFFIGTGLNRNLAPRNWVGRLSIGYPTMDCMVLLAGMIFSLTLKNTRKIVLFHMLSLLVMVFQNTASGYLLLSFYFFTMLFWLPGKWKIIPVTLFALGITLIWAIYRYLYEQFGKFGILIVDKVNGFFLGNETSSVAMREAQIELFKKELFSDLPNILFGGGGTAGFYVENHAFSLVGLSGLLGAAFSLIAMLVFALKSRHEKILLMLAGAYLVGGISLAVIPLYPFIFLLAYIVSAAGIKYSNT